MDDGKYDEFIFYLTTKPTHCIKCHIQDGIDQGNPGIFTSRETKRIGRI